MSTQSFFIATTILALLTGCKVTEETHFEEASSSAANIVAPSSQPSSGDGKDQVEQTTKTSARSTSSTQTTNTEQVDVKETRPFIPFREDFVPLTPLDLTSLAEDTPTPGEEDESASVESAQGTTEDLMPPTTLLTAEWFPHNDAEYRDHYGEATRLREEGRYEEAVEALRMELFDAPDSATTWLLLGETYAQLNRKEQALDAVHESLTFDPEFADAWAFIARFHLEEGQPSAAIDAAKQLVAQRPHDAEASHLLARSQMGLAMWSEAIETCKRTIAIDPEFTRAYNNLGFSALQIGQTEVAKTYLSEAAELPGVEAYMLNNLGIALERSGDHGDAARTFAKALELNPSYSRAALNRDRVQRRIDESVAAELARILAEREEAEGSSSDSASASVRTDTDSFGDSATP
jgi:tetratricopeptide (TPR) repeat protein